MANRQQLLKNIKALREEAEHEAAKIVLKYESSGGFYSTADRSDEDYLEGKVAAFDQAIDRIGRISNG